MTKFYLKCVYLQLVIVTSITSLDYLSLTFTYERKLYGTIYDFNSRQTAMDLFLMFNLAIAISLFSSKIKVK